jgi:ABC-type sugar transport system substrate-binding protein
MSQPKILVSLLSREQEFQVMQAADAQSAAERAGFEAEILYADQNAILQIQQLFKAIHAPAEQRPLAIVVETVVGEGLERVARNATRAGIGWVLLAKRAGYLEALRREYPNLPISSVSGDQLEMGRIQGRQFRALLPQGGVVLYIRGPSDTSDAQGRLDGAREATVGAGIELRILEGSWTEASAEKAVTNMLRLKTAESFRPGLVGAQNDAMAVGARRAALALRKDWAAVPFTGCDGLPDGGQRLVKIRQLAATIVTPSNAGPAINLIARWHKTKALPPAEIVSTPVSYPREDELGPRTKGE